MPLIWWIGAYTLLGQRVYFDRGPGEAVALANLIAIVLAVAILAFDRDERRTALSRLYRLPWPAWFIGLWVVMALAAPAVGYPIRSLFAATVPLAILAFVWMGSVIWTAGLETSAAIRRMLLVVAWGQFVVGLMQALFNTGALVTPLQRALIGWDVHAAAAFGVEVIHGRSSGLYLNPLVYSLLGAILLVIALTVRYSKTQRLLLALPAAGIVLMGASRGAILSLVVLAAVPLVHRARIMDRRKLIVSLLAGVASLGLAHVLLSLLLGDIYLRSLARWSTLPAVLAQGASGDVNALGRVSAWSSSLGYWISHPLGSFGPPQMAVLTFTDNDYVTFLIQGGLVLLVAYVGTLASTFARRGESSSPRTVGFLVGLMALSGLTQTSALFVPAFALFWTWVGTVAVAEDASPATGAFTRLPAWMGTGRREQTLRLIAIALLLLLIAIFAIRLSGLGYGAQPG